MTKHGVRWQNGAPILPRHKRLQIQPDTIYKMRHLLGKTVIPSFLIDREAPAFRGTGLFHWIICDPIIPTRMGFSIVKARLAWLGV
jgi:hypothetical protein